MGPKMSKAGEQSWPIEREPKQNKTKKRMKKKNLGPEQHRLNRLWHYTTINIINNDTQEYIYKHDQVINTCNNIVIYSLNCLYFSVFTFLVMEVWEVTFLEIALLTKTDDDYSACE